MKRPILAFLFGGTVLPLWAAEVGMLVLRVFAGLSLALAHGWVALPPPAGMVDGVAKMGFPAPTLWAWMAKLAEFVGGICLALGLGTRLASFFVACTMATAGFIHRARDPYYNKELAFVFLAIAIAFLLSGAGRLSIDALIRRSVRV